VTASVRDHYPEEYPTKRVYLLLRAEPRGRVRRKHL